MKKTLGIIIASLSLSSTMAFAGLTLSGDQSKYNSNTVSVSCTNSLGKTATLPAITNQNVAWFLVQGTFLSGDSKGHCIFSYLPTKAIMGEGDVLIKNNTGEITNIKPGLGYDITVAPDQTNYHANDIITVS
ncbi:hypothetical protein L3V82_12335 [Thiotrichales bacterium 19S3-7]|nr:hypothetical protein [Thiotrichales bacterium 19S3-7]MCF6802978.1 hypothetical protein [Thiotrichales bacterium 19S3-11]